jgi:hypothetical protein
MNDAYSIMFWLSIVFLITGGTMALLAVWVPEFFRSDLGTKLMLTNAVLFSVSLAGAVITRLLR